MIRNKKGLVYVSLIALFANQKHLKTYATHWLVGTHVKCLLNVANSIHQFLNVLITVVHKSTNFIIGKGPI